MTEQSATPTDPPPGQGGDERVPLETDGTGPVDLSDLLGDDQDDIEVTEVPAPEDASAGPADGATDEAAAATDDTAGTSDAERAGDVKAPSA